MSYSALKLVHVSCVAITASLLVLRLAMAASGRDYRRYAVLRWLPHAVDTVLLASALMLVHATGLYPFVEPWLTAKVLALPAYIIAAALALDPARPSRLRCLAGGASVLLLGWIVLTALARHPWVPG